MGSTILFCAMARFLKESTATCTLPKLACTSDKECAILCLLKRSNCFQKSFFCISKWVRSCVVWSLSSEPDETFSVSARTISTRSLISKTNSLPFLPSSSVCELVGRCTFNCWLSSVAKLLSSTMRAPSRAFARSTQCMMRLSKLPRSCDWAIAKPSRARSISTRNNGRSSAMVINPLL